MEKKRNDLKERSYAYALGVIRFLERLPKEYISQTLGRQLLRSATSVGANIVEAQACSTRKDFANFYTHSLKSANESRFWLGLIRDSVQLPSDGIGLLVKETEELANILASCLLSLKGRKNF
ncbi:MAG: four helix bundle protein [Candidatus Omnitrophica bacterium]|nr:four helix bundle protein [Candidatus Omnitrophota bacterium]